MAGLRFGDQILQIDGKTVAGWDTDKGMAFLKKTNPEKINFAVRDRYTFIVDYFVSNAYSFLVH